MDGDVAVRVAREQGSGVVNAVFYLEANPSEVELGRLKFDLTDDAELVAYAMVLRVLQRGGIRALSKSGTPLDSEELEGILERHNY